MKRFHHIDLIECIAILFVVIYHSRLYEYDFINGSGSIEILYYVRYFLRTILSTCVPLFFFSNGYLLFSKNYSLKRHTQRTIKLSLVPLWSLALMPIYQVLNGDGISIKAVIHNVLDLNIEWGVNSFWYIGALVCIYLLFPALKSLYDTDINSFQCLTCALFVVTFGIKLINQLLMFLNIAVGLPLSSINFPLFNMYIPFRQYGYSFVYFCLGGIALYCEQRINGFQNKNKYAVGILIASCVTLFLIGIFYSRYVLGSVWDVVWEGYDSIPTLANVIAIYALSLNVEKTNMILKEVSKNTLGIYVFHGLIIRLTRPFLLTVGICQNYIANIVYGVLIIIACLALIKAVQKMPLVKNLI